MTLGLLSPGIPNGALAACVEVTKMSNSIHTTTTVASILRQPLNYISGGYRADWGWHRLAVHFSRTSLDAELAGK